MFPGHLPSLETWGLLVDRLVIPLLADLCHFIARDSL
jgi:hypothetical protein